MSHLLNLSNIDSLLKKSVNGFVGQAIIQELETFKPENLPSAMVLVTRNSLNVNLPLSLSEITALVNQDLAKPWNIPSKS